MGVGVSYERETPVSHGVSAGGPAAVFVLDLLYPGWGSNLSVVTNISRYICISLTHTWWGCILLVVTNLSLSLSLSLSLAFFLYLPLSLSLFFFLSFSRSFSLPFSLSVSLSHTLSAVDDRHGATAARHQLALLGGALLRGRLGVPDPPPNFPARSLSLSHTHTRTHTHTNTMNTLTPGGALLRPWPGVRALLSLSHTHPPPLAISSLSRSFSLAHVLFRSLSPSLPLSLSLTHTHILTDTHTDTHHSNRDSGRSAPSALA